MIIKFLEITSKIFQSSEILHTVQNLGLAFLTILIPFAIAVFTIILQKKEEKKNLQELNLSVLLDEVFNLKSILGATVFIFIPFCFWSIFPAWWFRFTLILVSLLAIYFIGRAIWRVYKWVKGNEINYQINYLKKIDNPKELQTIWEDIWRSDEKILGLKKERKFLEVFITKTERFIKNKEKRLLRFFINKRNTEKNPEICGILLQDFLNYISNRSLQGLISILPKMLEWRFEILNKTYNKKEDNFLWDSGVFPPLIVIREIIREIIKRGLKSDNKWWVEKMFQKLKEHIDKHKEEKINDGFYLDFFFKDIDDLLFEKMAQSPLKYEICSRYFPSEWKITKEKLENGDKIPGVILSNFIEWMSQRIIDNQSMDFDNVLDYDLRCFFLNISSTYWAKILLFVFSSWTENNDYKNKVDYIIKNKEINFGRGESLGSVMTFSLDKTNKEEAMKRVEAEGERAMKDKIRNTFELVDFLSRYERNFYFFKKSLKKYITDLQNLEGKFKSESVEEHRRKRYLEVFNGFSEFLKNKS